MDWKEKIRFVISISLLVFFIVLMVAFTAVSSGVIDLTPEPIVNAEENTTGVPEASPSKEPNIDGRDLEIEIFTRVNEWRETHGREPFVHSERVRLIARLHSADMAKRDFFSHWNPDGNSPPDRHDRYNGCDRPNENIAEWETIPTNDTDEIANAIVNSWTNSSGHNTTQLSEYYHVSGVGVYVTENRSLYVTMNFCREHPNA